MQELSHQILTDIRNQFEQIDECPVQGKRVFFENAGGALTLKSVVKCSMKTRDLVVDCYSLHARQ